MFQDMKPQAFRSQTVMAMLNPSWAQDELSPDSKLFIEGLLF